MAFDEKGEKGLATVVLDDESSFTTDKPNRPEK